MTPWYHRVVFSVRQYTTTDTDVSGAGTAGSGESRGPPRRKAALAEESSTHSQREAIASTGAPGISAGGVAIAVLAGPAAAGARGLSCSFFPSLAVRLSCALTTPFPKHEET